MFVPVFFFLVTPLTRLQHRCPLPEPSTPQHVRDTSPRLPPRALEPRSQRSPARSHGPSGAIFFEPGTHDTHAFSESRCMIFQGAHHHLCRSQVVLLPSASLCPRPARTHLRTRGFLRPVSEILLLVVFPFFARFFCSCCLSSCLSVLCVFASMCTPHSPTTTRILSRGAFRASLPNTVSMADAEYVLQSDAFL